MPVPSDTKPVTDPPPPADEYLALQRCAVRAWSALLADAVDPQLAQLENAQRQARATSEQEWTERRDRAAAALQEQLAAAEREHAGRLARLQAEYDAGQAALARTATQAAADAQAEYADAEREAQRRRDDDALMLETATKAALRGLRDQLVAAQREAAAGRQRLGGLRERAARAFARHGWPPPEDPAAPTAPDAAPAGVPAAAHAADNSTRATRAADPSRHIAAIEGLVLPPFGIGGHAAMLLVLLNLVPAAVALAGGLLPIPNASLWLLGGLAGLVFTFILSLAIRHLLREKARARLHAVALAEYAGLQTALASFAAALEQRLRHAEQQLHREAEKTAATRDRDAQAVAAQYEATVFRADCRRNETIQAAQAARTRGEEELSARHAAAVAETDRAHQRRCAELEAAHAQARAAADAARERQISVQTALHTSHRSELEREWPAQLACLRELLARIEQLRGAPAPDWHAPPPANWTPPAEMTELIRFGAWQLDLGRLAAASRAGVDFFRAEPAAIDVPVVLALPRTGSLFLETGRTGRDEAIATLRAVMLRLLTSLPPGRVRFTILDPIGLGESFAGFMHLADYADALVGGRIWTEADHIGDRLGELTAHMETVIQKYLRNEFETIDA
ncbi:MAG: hypothetical protein AB1716_05475, partial [Planctomycetota bacterium]